MPTPVVATAWLPLSRAMICVEDETIFDLEFQACPACGSDQRMPLKAWLGTVEVQ